MAQGESKRENPPEIPKHKRQPVLVHLARKKGNEDGFPGIRLPRFEKIEEIGERIIGEKNESAKSVKTRKPRESDTWEHTSVGSEAGYDYPE